MRMMSILRESAQKSLALQGVSRSARRARCLPKLRCINVMLESVYRLL